MDVPRPSPHLIKKPRLSRVSFGSFELDVISGELFSGGEKVLLQEQPLQILRMLIEAKGEVVSRDAIRSRLWPNDTIVEFDHSINAAIKNLRRALDDSAQEPRYVETIARRGYRLMVKVESLSGSSSDSSPALESPPSDPGSAFAVAGPAADLIGKKVSHYRVLEVVGGGGMGVVYKAEDLKLGRRVAMKFLPEELGDDAKSRERFEREARAASALDHPNICAIHEFGEHDGQPFIVMPLLEGQNLRDLIATTAGPFLVTDILNFGIQIASGLEAAHEGGVIHRDIKPANIFVTERGEAKILDFGLAKLTAATGGAEIGVAARTTETSRSLGLTLAGVALGTAPYMSPEQVRGEPLDVRTDIFSFGLVLYEMATGQRAFSSQTTMAVHDAVLNRTPVPVRDLNSTLPAKLVAIIDKCLQKERGQRYQSAAEVRRALQEVQRSAGIRQRRTLLALSAVALIAVFAVGWYLLRRSATPTRLATERQITFNPLENPVTGGSVSPDGKLVAYRDLTGVYVRSIDSGETRPLKLSAELSGRKLGYVNWFPGGDKLIAPARSPEGSDIWEINVLGEAKERLLFRNGYAPVVSPDGQTIAYTNGEYAKGGQSILLSSSNGGSPRKFVDAEPGGGVAHPTWSPDCRWLAYARQSKIDDVAIMVRPLAGGAESAIVTDSALPISYKVTPSFGGLAWCRDGRLVFPVNDQGELYSTRTHSSLWQVKVDLTSGRIVRAPSRLTMDSEGLLLNPTCAPSSDRLSVVKVRLWPDIYVADLSPDGTSMNAPRRLTMDNRGGFLNNWTRDSHAVLFSSDRNGTNQIFRQAIDSTVAEPVVQGPQGPGKVSLFWGANMSPDGRWVLYREDGKSADPHSAVSWLMRKPSEGGTADRLIQISDADGYQCALNPKAVLPCILSHAEGSRIAFYALDPLQGKGKRLAELPGKTNWDLCPDGSKIALLDVDPHGARIVIIATSDGSFKDIFLEPGVGLPHSISWAADAKGFYVLSTSPEWFDLLYVTTAGKSRMLWRRNRNQWDGVADNVIASPDGKHLAIATQSWDSNVWLIDDF